jgi:hypothetical protein
MVFILSGTFTSGGLIGFLSLPYLPYPIKVWSANPFSVIRVVKILILFFRVSTG